MAAILISGMDLLSSVIFVISGNSAVFKNIIPITVSLTIGLLH